MNKRSKSTKITKEIYQKVLERDNFKCCISGRSNNLECHHVLFRSCGGMGIVENLVMVNKDIHHLIHNTKEQKKLTKVLKNYLDYHYPGFDDNQRRYKKYNFQFYDKKGVR